MEGSTTRSRGNIRQVDPAAITRALSRDLEATRRRREALRNALIRGVLNMRAG